MTAPFTIGIEEEYQMVDRQTGQLSPSIHTILEKGYSIFGEQIKAEMLQSMVEINSDNELLDFVDEVVDDMGSRPEMNYLRGLLEDPRGTGADRQIALFQETGSIDAVIQFLMQQTTQGIALVNA